MPKKEFDFCFTVAYKKKKRINVSFKRVEVAEGKTRREKHLIYFLFDR
jgi:hypothetical protein